MKTFIVFLLAITSAVAYAVPKKSVDWRLKAKRDLIFIHQFLVDNHPGVLYTLDTDFQYWLKEGATVAEAKLAQVKTQADYQALLSEYLKGFQEGHMSLSFNTDPPSVIRWPGFVTVQLQGKATVIGTAAWALSLKEKLPANVVQALAPDFKIAQLEKYTQAFTPKHNATLISCDGKSYDELLQARDFPLRPELKIEDLGKRLLDGRVMFLDIGNPLWNRPKVCKFDEDGKTREIKLRWQDLPVQLYSIMMGPLEVGHMFHEISLTKIPVGLWLNMPGFMGKGVDEGYAKLRTELQPALKEKPRVIVFDLRGNYGGSTVYSETLLKDIYGEKLYERMFSCATSGYQVIRRATPAVLAQYRQKQNTTSAVSEKESKDMQQQLKNLGDHLETAMKEGRKSIGTDLTEFNKPLPPQDEYVADPSCKITAKEAAKFPRPVILFDYFCASACTMFMDLIEPFENRILLGQPSTHRDPYMETGEVPLPTGEGNLKFPTMLERRTKQRLTYHPNWWLFMTHLSDKDMQEKVAGILKDKYQIQ